MKYTQPQLPYANNALEPVISQQTIDYHYGRHTKTYIENLNALIEHTRFSECPLEDIIHDAEGALFNNASQAWNHIFYFFSFSPYGGGEPEGDLRAAIDRQFGSFEKFKQAFVDAGVKLFGSGWVWLSGDSNGKLFITQEPNAGNPLQQGRTPLLTFDLWEHAYYLDYQNRRKEALDKLWDIIDWPIVEGRFENI
jgi:Fe-Mn family superoxide dismutase